MNFPVLFAKVALLGLVALAAQGLDWASGGDLYLSTAYRQWLAQAEPTAPPPPEPVPPPPSGSEPQMGQPMPQPPGGSIFPERPYIPYDSSQARPPEGGQFPYQPGQPGQPGQPRQPGQPGQPGQFGQPGQPGQPGGQFMPGGFPGGKEPMDEKGFPGGFFGEGEDESEPVEFVSPGEIRQVISQIKQLLSRIKRFEKKATGAMAGELAAIKTELNAIFETLSKQGASGSLLREAFEEFHGGEFHQRVGNVEAALNIPREIKEMEKAIKKVLALIKTKAVKALGFNLSRVEQSIAELRAKIDEVKGHLASNNFEEAQDVMQSIREERPWAMESVIQQVRQIKEELKRARIKDQTVLVQANAALDRVYSLYNESDYGGAEDELRAVREKIMPLLWPQKAGIKR